MPYLAPCSDSFPHIYNRRLTVKRSTPDFPMRASAKGCCDSGGASRRRLPIRRFTGCCARSIAGRSGVRVSRLALTLALSRKRERGQSGVNRELALRFCGRDCRALLYPGPSRPRRAGGGKVATAIAGRMPASLPTVHGRTAGKPRNLLAESQGHGCPCDRDLEGAFLWLLSLCKQRK